MVVNVYELALWAAIFFTVLGGVLGLIGVWIKNFWSNDIAPKLIFTDVILAVTSIIVAAIMEFLAT